MSWNCSVKFPMRWPQITVLITNYIQGPDCIEQNSKLLLNSMVKPEITVYIQGPDIESDDIA